MTLVNSLNAPVTAFGKSLMAAADQAAAQAILGVGAGFINFSIVWADPNGNDSTGDGSFANPYASIMGAQASILDAASSKMYMIVWTGVTATIVTPILKPWIFWAAFNNFDLNAYCVVNFTNPITLDSSFSGVVAEAGLIGFNLRNVGVVADFDNSAMTTGTQTTIHLFRIRPYAQVNCTTIAGNSITANIKYSEIQRLIMNGGYLNTQNCTIGYTTINASTALGPFQHQSTNDTYQSYFEMFGLDGQSCYTIMTGASWAPTGLPILRGTGTYITGDMASYHFPNLLDTVSVDNSSFRISGYNNTAKKILIQNGFQFYDDVMAASQVNFTATYNNSSSGNGATLTNAGEFAPFNIDGLYPNTFAVEVGMRFLIKNQSTAFQNGIYVLTTLGDAISVNWVLTRAEDFNSFGAVQENMLTLVCFGDNNQNRIFRVDANIATMGTTAINISVLNFFDVFGSSTGTINKVVPQSFTTPGAITYTRTAGCLYAIVEMVGGGAASGSLAGGSGAGNLAASGGGGAGGSAKFILSAAQIGTSLAGVVGAAGAAGATGNHPGGDGGSTTLATTSAWTCAGGIGGDGNAASLTPQVTAGGVGGTVTTGTGSIAYVNDGQTGGTGWSSVIASGGVGGNSSLGLGGISTVNSASANTVGASGTGYGAGAGGSTSLATNSGVAGKDGQPGAIFITEYCS